MKLLIVSLVITVAVLGASGFSSRPAEAVPPWPPLLNCPDTDGSGSVDLFNDIFGVSFRFGTAYPSDDYLLLYDVDGGGNIDLFGDIFSVAFRFGEVCPLIDRQVALGTQAILQFQDCQDALETGGYIQVTQFVPSMGIHLFNIANMVLYPDFWSGDPADTDDQLRHPVGLMCTDSDPDPNVGVADEAIGAFYAVPNPEVCAVYGIPGPCQDASTQPVGFGDDNEDEDNTWISSFQKTWHTHSGLCVWNVGTTGARTGEGWAEADCLALPASAWFSTYGWMMHLYAFIPHQDNRFAMWNFNVPPE